jgi:hypothetical protein
MSVRSGLTIPGAFRLRFLVATERDNDRESQSRLRRILGGQMVVNMVVKPFATLTVLLLQALPYPI